jgi:hypothetical protein
VPLQEALETRAGERVTTVHDNRYFGLNHENNPSQWATAQSEMGNHPTGHHLMRGKEHSEYTTTNGP